MIVREFREQIIDARCLADALEKMPDDKRPIAIMAATAFISGMEAQEQLAEAKVS